MKNDVANTTNTGNEDNLVTTINMEEDDTDEVNRSVNEKTSENEETVINIEDEPKEKNLSGIGKHLFMKRKKSVDYQNKHDIYNNSSIIVVEPI